MMWGVKVYLCSVHCVVVMCTIIVGVCFCHVLCVSFAVVVSFHVVAVLACVVYHYARTFYISTATVKEKDIAVLPPATSQSPPPSHKRKMSSVTTHHTTITTSATQQHTRLCKVSFGFDSGQTTQGPAFNTPTGSHRPPRWAPHPHCHISAHWRRPNGLSKAHCTHHG